MSAKCGRVGGATWRAKVVPVDELIYRLNQPMTEGLGSMWSLPALLYSNNDLYIHVLYIMYTYIYKRYGV